MDTLFPELLDKKTIHQFPQTRYQGSKLKLLNWIWENIRFLNFSSVADVFGGTGSVSYLFKTKFKNVLYNDVLRFNYYAGLALIENQTEKISESDINFILSDSLNYSEFKIQTLFKGIYYLDEENIRLDKIVQNIFYLAKENEFKRALLLWPVFQACLVKRPFNLFHRKNLNMRLKTVKRTFGNKVTWDKPFEFYIKKFSQELNRAIFDNQKNCKALNLDVFDLSTDCELVYIDPPYTSRNGVSVDYHQFYHFLEGLCYYDSWEEMIDRNRAHFPLKKSENIWNDKSRVEDAFASLVEKFRYSHIVISYRSDGIPSLERLLKIVKDRKKNVKLVMSSRYKYVLSTNGNSKEALIIGWD